MLAAQAKKIAQDETYNACFNHCAAPHELEPLMGAFAAAGVKLNKVYVAVAPPLVGAAYATDGIVLFEMWPAASELSSKYSFKFT